MTLLTIFIWLGFQICSAPPLPAVAYIEKPEEINYYDPLISALTYVEVKDGKELYNELEGAVGWFQIRQCRVDDYNKRTGSHYLLIDFYDYALSRQMFLYFAYNKSYEQAAKNWNGSGKMTEIYWEKVKRHLKGFNI